MEGGIIMLYIDGNIIRLTRGDTAYLTVPIVTESGEEYVMQSGDILSFSVKKNESMDEYLFQKVVTGSNAIHIEPNDTTNIPFGKYRYDVQLNLASGDVFTVIEPNTFEIMKEVTR